MLFRPKKSSLAQGHLRRPVGAWLALLTACALPALAQNGATPPVEPDPPQAVSSDMDAELFYQLLVGEMQLQAGEAGAGYSLVLDAARRTQRQELYRRAVEIALQGRSGDAALTAARAWSDAHPGASEPHRYALQILLALNRPADVVEALRQLVRLTPVQERNELIAAIPQTMARASDKAAARQAVTTALQEALRDRATAAAAWTSIGRMQLASDQLDQALASARQAHQADPTLAAGALLGLELMERQQEGAEGLVRRHLELTGERASATVRMGYARVLLDHQRYAEASAHLQTLTVQEPDYADPWLLLGTLQVQQNQLDAARASLERYLELSRRLPAEQATRGQTQAFLQLAQIAERQKDYVAAGAWLDRIENGEEIMAAQMRRAMLLGRQGQLERGIELLRQQPERNPADARRKFISEAQLLREFGRYEAALEVYTRATARFPDDPDLVYEQAMLAEKAGRPDELERLLRGLIARHPDYHHAYNALGYTLADRNERLPEARALILKALEFAPGDPYIQDSLGWVEYRMGNLTEALRILQAAYAKRPDAEIAAHLGEVQWVLGQRDQALRIWREGLLLNPENDTLLDTIRRFDVRP
jgi:tetratricopeptide (TPR) repeat protein